LYKFEIHLHSSGCSACGASTAKEMIDAAVFHNYSGVVFTNHFYHGNTCVNRNLPWEEFVKAYEDDYIEAREYGKEKGIKVFFGIEEGYLPGKEMLIYGLSPADLKKHPEFIMLNAKEKSELVRHLGGICVCAHPYRDRSYIPEPEVDPDISLFDGVECYNLNNTPEENEKAFRFAKENNLLQLSGGDVHSAENFGHAGIDFNHSIPTYKEFLKQLKKGNYKLIIDY